MIVIFQGYAAYVVMQHYFKGMLDAYTGERQDTFTASTTLMHWGKLFARVGHDIMLPCLSTRSRVMVAMLMTAVAVVVPPMFVWGMGSRWLGWAFIHYGLLGLGVGIFEGNFLASISPLGQKTKVLAIMGTPIGLATVDIIGQLLCSAAIVGNTAHHNNPQYVYWYIAACIPFGMVVYWRECPEEAGGVAQKNILRALADWKGWLPKMIPFFLAKLIGNFVMENTPGWFYVFNGSKVPMFSPSGSSNLLDPDIYFCMIYVFVLMGDSLSRQFVYALKLESQCANSIVICLSIVCSCLGFYLESFTIAVVTLVAGFIAFWGNGLAYAVATKYIDSNVNSQHTRAVYGLWTLVGDVGSIAGAWLVVWVNNVFCKQAYEYVCVGH